jgi:hypothetical protein
VAGVAALTIAAAPCFPKSPPISFGQYKSAEELRRECLSRGNVLKAAGTLLEAHGGFHIPVDK